MARQSARQAEGAHSWITIASPDAVSLRSAVSRLRPDTDYIPTQATDPLRLHGAREGLHEIPAAPPAAAVCFLKSGAHAARRTATADSWLAPGEGIPDRTRNAVSCAPISETWPDPHNP